MKLQLKAVAVVVLIAVACAAANAAGPCDISAEVICQLNGAGVHCHACRPDSYVVCVDNDSPALQTCSAGNVWDAYAARCVAPSPKVGSCIPGVTVVVPSDFFGGNTAAQPAQNAFSPQTSQHEQSWAQWAASGLSTFVESANDQLTSLATLVLPQQQQQQQQSGSSPDPAYMLPLRMTMVVGSGSSDASMQLQHMRQGLARAASLQQAAMLLVRDAEEAESAAEQQMRAAHELMSADAEPNSSSSSGEAGGAAYQAGQLLRGAQQAQQAADELSGEAEVLLQAAATEAADVAMAISGDLDQQASSSSTSGSQRFYGPAALGAIFGTSAARSAAATASIGSLEDEYYYDESDNDYYDESDNGDSSFNYFAPYTYGEVEPYFYDDDDDLMGLSAPPAAAASLSAAAADFYEPNTAAAEPHVFGPIPAAAAALLGHLAEIHGEDAYSRPDLLHWAARGGSGSSLPPPAWPSTGPVVAMPPRFVSSSSSSSSNRHYLADPLFGHAGAQQQQQYFYDDELEAEPAAPTAFSGSIILGSALQDRLVKLAAKAAAAAQQQLDATTTSSSNAQEVEDIATILEQSGPLPMSMTIKREQEVLQLASFFDALYPKLSAAAAAQLHDLDFSRPEVLDAALVGGLPALQLGQSLAAVMGLGDAAVLRSMLHAQMAELFADFVALSYPDADYAQLDTAATPSRQYDAAALYDYADNADYEAERMAEEAAASRPAGKAVQPAAEFKDAALLQQLDYALLQLESEQQPQQQQQQPQQQGETGHKAAGLALPGMKRASTHQQAV